MPHSTFSDQVDLRNNLEEDQSLPDASAQDSIDLKDDDTGTYDRVVSNVDTSLASKPDIKLEDIFNDEDDEFYSSGSSPEVRESSPPLAVLYVEIASLLYLFLSELPGHSCPQQGSQIPK